MNPQLTLLNDWNTWHEESESPQAFIDYALFSLVAACLERRVWLVTNIGSGVLFPNLYTVLIADAGIGKGVSIFPVLDILRMFREADYTGVIPGIKAELQEMAKEANIDPRGMKIPIGPSSATLPAVLKRMPELSKPVVFRGKKIVHCSLFVCLEEMTTFINGTDDVRDFLLQAYDCSHYIRDLKTEAAVYVMNMCLNFLAGTTPQNFGKVLGEHALNDGFCSRTTFVYGPKKRKYVFKPEYQQRHLDAKRRVIAHVGQLIALTGEKHFTPEATAFLRHWYETIFPVSRINQSPILSDWYARKRVLVQKMALIMSMIREPTMEAVTLFDVQEALARIEAIEPDMHVPLVTKTRNELAKLPHKIANWLAQSSAPQTPAMLLEQFYTELRSPTEAAQIILDTHRMGLLVLDNNLLLHKRGTTCAPPTTLTIHRLTNTLDPVWTTQKPQS